MKNDDNELSSALDVIAGIGGMLLSSAGLSEVIMKVLAELGGAFGIDRAYIFKNRPGPEDGSLYFHHCYEWCAEGIEPQIENASLQGVSYSELPGLRETLSSGRIFKAVVSDLSAEEKKFLEPQGIKSVLIVPIIFGDVFWGFAGFDDCENERDWTEAETRALSIVSDMTSNYIIRENISDELKQNERRWCQALEGSGEGVWDYDLKSGRVFISDKGKALLGIRNGSGGIFPETSDRDVLKNECGSAAGFLEKVLENAADSVDKEFVHTVDGRERWFHSRGVVVSKGVFGEPLRVIGTFSDVTERKSLDIKLKNALEEAQSANRAKSAFLATMSHEIRTPLNGMIGFMRLLSDHVSDESGREYLRIMDESATTLLNVINSILDLSRAESGNMVLESVECCFQEELEAIARLFSASAFEKNVYLRAFIDPLIPTVLRCDQLRLRQVLSNLLNNALKFTPSGGHIYLEGRVVEKNAGSVRIKFAVRDTGIGVAKDLQEEVFEPFIQADSSVSRKFGGSGLGLTIAKRFVELMGGSLALESEPGKGSVFYFTLEFPVVRDTDFKPASSGIVAYVEDSPNHWGMGDGLEALGFETALYESASALLEDPRIRDYRAVIFSSFAVDENLIANVGRVKAALPDTPVALLSYPADSSPELSALGATGVKMAVRPISLSRLSRLIDRAKPEISFGGSAKISGGGKARYSGRVLIAEDNAINGRLVKILLKRYGLETEMAADGKQACAMAKNGRFDLILMDINMPVMDGVAAARNIRARERELGLERVPIVALTAAVLKNEPDGFCEAGIDDVLIKPLASAALEKALDFFLGRREPAGQGKKETL